MTHANASQQLNREKKAIIRVTIREVEFQGQSLLSSSNVGTPTD